MCLFVSYQVLLHIFTVHEVVAQGDVFTGVCHSVQGGWQT